MELKRQIRERQRQIGRERQRQRKNVKNGERITEAEARR